MPLEYVYIASKYDKRIDELAERLRLGVKSAKRAKKSKAHSTNKERSYAARKAHSQQKHRHAEHLRNLAKYIALVKAYWAGESDVHP